MRTTLFQNALLADGSTANVLADGGRIAAVTPADPSATADHVVECDGRLLAPSFTEGHTHLDKTFAGLPHVPHRRGVSVRERIDAEKALRREIPADIGTRGGALLRQMVAAGTGRVRSHVDIDPEIGLSSLHDVVALKEHFGGVVDMQIVAFPQSGIVQAPGTAELMDAAMSEGATHVGGLDPAAIDGDREAHLDTVFSIAERHGAGIDIHLHEGGEGGLLTLSDIAGRTKAAGLSGRVVVSHAFGLGEPHDIGPTVSALREAGVAILTHGPGPVPMPPVMQLIEGGVTVLAGSDNVRDAWSPYGDADMLRRAMMIGYRQGMNADEEIATLFEIITRTTAETMGFGALNIAPGAPADLVLIDAKTVVGAVAQPPPRIVVMKAGRVVAENGVYCA
ncbi:MAG: amidohydrolase [Pseudomonadota bacterium]